MSTDALASLVWQNVIAVDYVHLANFGTIEVKSTRNLVAVTKGLLTFSGGPLVDGNVDVDLWWYRVFSERPYVADLCSFTEGQLSAWLWFYMVHAYAL